MATLYPWATRAVLLLAASAAGGCLTATQSLEGDLQAASWVDAPGNVLVVADGAGDFRAASAAIRRAVLDEDLPLQVETFVWSHGYLMILPDQLGHDHAREEGRRLANLLRARRQAVPGGAIYLAGHSAGSAVILAAAEQLPPGTVERIVLLSPSVPEDYDVRPALRAVRSGMDVYHSQTDWYLRGALPWVCLLRAELYTPAGATGFRTNPETAEDMRCYAKLRQYPWEPSLACTGHLGGHYGCYQQTFLKSIVLPHLVE